MKYVRYLIIFYRATLLSYFKMEVGELGFIGTGNSVSGDKYEAISTDSGYNKYMMLKIRNVGPKDFGSYKCVAQNSLGGTDGVIKLDGKSCKKTMYSVIFDLL